MIENTNEQESRHQIVKIISIPSLLPIEGWVPFENQRTKMECSCRRKLGTFLNCKKKNKNNENIYNTSNKTAQRILYIYKLRA